MDIINFNGRDYALLSSGYYLSQSKTNKGRKGAKGLHVAIYEFYSGKQVPKGFIVHHKDGNRLNNNYGNLECITKSEHSKKHPEAYRYTLEEKYKKYFSLKSKEMWKKRIKTSKLCGYCNSEFETYYPLKAEYCSQKCYNRYYYVSKIKAS